MRAIETEAWTEVRALPGSPRAPQLSDPFRPKQQLAMRIDDPPSTRPRTRAKPNQSPERKRRAHSPLHLDRSDSSSAPDQRADTTRRAQRRRLRLEPPRGVHSLTGPVTRAPASDSAHRGTRGPVERGLPSSPRSNSRRGPKSTLPTRAGAAHAPISMSRTRVMQAPPNPRRASHRSKPGSGSQLNSQMSAPV